MTAQWMCEVGRGKAKKMQLRLIRSPACITGKPREAAAHAGARRALEPALRGPAGAVDGEVARGLQPRRGVGRQAPPSSAGTGTTQESVSKPDLGTRAAHGSVNPPRLHAPRDARTRLWFLFSSYLSAPERLRKPTRTPSPRPGPSPRSRAPARPTLPARTPRRSSARLCPRLRRRRTLLLLPYLPVLCFGPRRSELRSRLERRTARRNVLPTFGRGPLLPQRPLRREGSFRFGSAAKEFLFRFLPGHKGFGP